MARQIAGVSFLYAHFRSWDFGRCKGVNYRMWLTALTLIPMCVELANGQVPGSESSRRPAFTMSIKSQQTAVDPGSEVIIDVDLINVSSQEIQIIRVGSGPPQYTFEVLDRDGKAAPLTPLGEAMASGKNCWRGRNGEMRCFAGGSVSSNRLSPGGKLHDLFCLSAYVDLSQPSQYTVRLERTDPYTHLRVESNTISLTVARRK